ncbi:nuclease homologue [Halogranum amylolyticum]|uniref:Nuclease homologue n=1 Tax=Halogranum amylolyticum TaxID=660520 RepID=A0A1H8WKA0_9EURY|nr:thermonuclease family protein [Halogranum amylolyticum]SEP28110.1 nuclease homologue [Halogranum amylolyticum]
MRRVVDGDTIRVAYADGSTGLVDLVGVDAPDLYGGGDPEEFVGVPDSGAGRTYLYAWGWVARGTLRQLVADQSVRLRFVDSAPPTVDDYATTAEYDDVRAAVVSVEGTDVNRALLRRGVARATDTDHPDRESHLETTRTAQQDGRGLWGTADGLSVP